MNILVIRMDGLDPEIVYGEDLISEQLVNFHRIMEIGCYGPLEIGKDSQSGTDGGLRNLTIWADKQKIIPPFDGKNKGFSDLDAYTGEIVTYARNSFTQVINSLKASDWIYLEYVDTGLSTIYSTFQSLAEDVDNSTESTLLLNSTIRNYYLFLNEQLGRLFENIDQDLVISIISRHGPNLMGPGFFILTAPNNPLEGEIRGTKLFDLDSTLLDLGGYEIPASQPGKSLVAGKTLLETSLSDKDEEEILRERLSGLGYF